MSRRDPEQQHGDDCDANEHSPSHDAFHRKPSTGTSRGSRDAKCRRECHSLADGAENPATADDGPRELRSP
jgi:hypothetical protein